MNLRVILSGAKDLITVEQHSFGESPEGIRSFALLRMTDFKKRITRAVLVSVYIPKQRQ